MSRLVVRSKTRPLSVNLEEIDPLVGLRSVTKFLILISSLTKRVKIAVSILCVENVSFRRFTKKTR